MTFSTTLMTFYLETPPDVSLVQLFGSWDNFSQPYNMEKDSRIARGQWKGCHNFRNIICDGKAMTPGMKREGGLKMGGKYWYYYRLDDDTDSFNPNLPTTTTCPFLPGQVVNILDVPIHIGCDEIQDDDSYVLAPWTMNPQDKYLNPRPPPEKPRVLRLATSALPLRPPSASTHGSRSSSRSDSRSQDATVRSDRHLLSAHQRPDHRKGRSLSPRPFEKFRTAVASHRKTRSVGSDSTNAPCHQNCPRDVPLLKIGEPVLISRTDNGRHCLPISAPNTSPSPRNSIPTELSSTEKPWVALSTEARSSVTRNVRTSEVTTICTDIQDFAVSPSLRSTVGSEPSENDQFGVSTQFSRTFQTDKKLPSLPSSPSSVVEGSPAFYDYPKVRPELRSHFSDWTVTTAAGSESTCPVSPCESVPSFSGVPPFRPLTLTTNFDNEIASLSSLAAQPESPEFSELSDIMSDDQCSSAALSRPASSDWGSSSYQSERLELELEVAIHGLRIDNAAAVSPDDKSETKQESQLYSLPADQYDSQLTVRRQSRISVNSGFQVYSLPESEHTSQLTLRKSSLGNGLPTLPPLPGLGGHVEDDDNRASLVQQIFDELGYLGDAIA